MRHRRGSRPQNYQILGKYQTFHCGCVVLLPSCHGVSDKFTRHHRHNSRPGFWCRVSNIIDASRNAARKHGYKPIPANTPHSVIHKMMEEPNCERCGLPLIWQFGIGKTPHLHHNHETGEIYGFTHPVCNPHAMQQEIERLKIENALLRSNR